MDYKNGSLTCDAARPQRSSHFSASADDPEGHQHSLLWCLHSGLHHVHNIIAHRIKHEVTDRVQL
jgi:hypothetical protein